MLLVVGEAKKFYSPELYSMKEIQLNTLVFRSLNSIFGYKIPDPSGGVGGKRPFDGFGYLKDFPINIECKLIKEKYGKFNFNKFQDHQILNLVKIKNGTRHWKTHNPICIFLIAVWFPRKYFDMFFIDIDFVTHRIDQGAPYISKKEFMEWIQQGKNLRVPVGHKTFNAEEIVSRIIGA